MGNPDGSGSCGGPIRVQGAAGREAVDAYRACALTVYFQSLELRHKPEIYNLTGSVAECPLDEMNRPREPQG
jgi:hypothetical protein